MAKQLNEIIKKGVGTRLKEKLGFAKPDKVEKSKVEKDYSQKLMQSEEIQKPTSALYIYHLFNYHIKLLCKDFLFDDENLDFIRLLCLYFAKDNRFNTMELNDNSNCINERNLDKGLLIFGNYGFGKSLIIKAFKNISIPGNRFYYHHANEIVMEYSKNGYAGLETFLKSNCYYDDLGTEDKAGHYEQKKELFKTIIEARYNQFINQGIRTHISTNLNPDEIAERYGERIESRIYEMFNIIVVSGTDRRKK